MKALVIEDELMVQKNLIKILADNFPEIDVIGKCASVKSSVEWLKENSADVIFMDVELSDGNSFEIFRQIQISAQVIMTTAYDNYAIKAFEEGSVDYILKPIDLTALQRAITRVKANLEKGTSTDFQKIMSLLGKPSAPTYKERFLVKFNDMIVPVNSNEIAFIYSEEKENKVVTNEGIAYITDSSLDTFTSELNPEKFFKISRSCIMAKDNIASVSKILGGRLKVIARNGLKRKGEDPDLTVSRARTDDFLKWLEN